MLQAHTALKLECEEIDAQRRLLTSRESELGTKHSELQGIHTATLQRLSSVESEKGVLTSEKLKIQAQANSAEQLVSELQTKLAQAAAEIAMNGRQLYSTQSELKDAVRRADDAEKIQNDLQAEGTNLMRSLDELRPKVVELTGVKMDLSEKISGLEHALQGRDATIAQLEATLEEVGDAKEEGEMRAQEAVARREKERLLALSDLSDVQKAYAELQEELDIATASLHNLEAERSSHHQQAARRLEEIEQLNASSRGQSEELLALRRELHAREDAQVSHLTTWVNELDNVFLP